MTEEKLYNKFAKYYEKIYSNKDYDKEFRFIEDIISKYNISGKRVLDMACMWYMNSYKKNVGIMIWCNLSRY